MTVLPPGDFRCTPRTCVLKATTLNWLLRSRLKISARKITWSSSPRRTTPVPGLMQAQGSQLTNKYAEGYPGKRYYGGCEFVDIAEKLAIERVKKLFDCDYANVQPHSGSQANQAVYFALLNPGDTILGMSLAHGGHLTHGAKVNLSGKIFNAVQYGVNDQGMIDYDEVERLALEHKPKMLVAGFSAYSQDCGLGTHARDRRQDRRLFLRRHGACRRTCRGGRLSKSLAACARGHFDHAQNPARTTWRHCRGQGRGRRDREEIAVGRIPRNPGRPADACHRSEGRRVQGSTGTGVQGLSAKRRQERAGNGQDLHRAQIQDRFRPARSIICFSSISSAAR